MNNRIQRLVVLWSASAALIFWGAGCETLDMAGGGGDQLQRTIYDTYRLTRRLEDDLGSTVNQLNETATTLSGQVDKNEQELAKLETSLRQNQQKIDEIQAQLDSLKNALYGHLGLTAGQTATSIPAQSANSSSGQQGPAASTTDGGASSQAAAQDQDAEGAYYNAQRALVNGEYADALKQYSSFLDQYPGSSLAPNAQYWRGECYFRLAQERKESGLYEQAIQTFQQLRTQYPQSENVPRAMFDMAQAYLGLGQATRAREILQEIVDEYPLNAAAQRARTKLQEMDATR